MSKTAPHITPPDTEKVRHIIKEALAEDIGKGDITSNLLIPESVTADMHFVAREGVIACGMFIAGLVYASINPAIKVETIAEEGTTVTNGKALVRVTGPARGLLTGERVALNLIQRMCGVATLTHVYVDAVRGTNAVILDTRKTMPGLRELDKYAIRTGGGQNHRLGLDDMVLIKDNHLAVGSGIADAVAKARAGTKLMVEVECDTYAQVEEAMTAKPDRILLDNMDLATLRRCVELSAGRIPLEASGGVSLDTIRAIAETGVDFISVGRLTHSAPAADIGADIIIHHQVILPGQG